MKTHLIIDAGSLSYWKLFSLISKNKGFDDKSAKIFLLQESDEGFPNWQLLIENEVINLIDKFDPDICTIACDGRSLWRKHYYPEYKANRKSQRAEYPIDWDKFYEIRDATFMRLSDRYPIKVIMHNQAEADDIIAILTKQFHETEEIIAVTGDADLHQLFRFSNFRCYDAKKHEEVTGIDWYDLLMVKIISGDRGDNIKAIRPRIGKVTARSILEECQGNIHKYCEDNNLSKELELNQKIINFEFIPNKLIERILGLYENAKLNYRDHSYLAMNSVLSYSEIMFFMNKKLFKCE
jgi:5'-3' exonuclease